MVFETVSNQPVPGDHRSPAIQLCWIWHRSPSYPAVGQRPTRHPTLPVTIGHLATQLCWGWVVAGLAKFDSFGATTQQSWVSSQAVPDGQSNRVR